MGHIAPSKSATDRRRRDRLQSKRHRPNLAHLDDLQSNTGACLSEELQIAPAPVAKMHVRTDDEDLRSHLTDERILHELHGGPPRDFLVEVD